jgi:hypothetical protein
MTEKSNQNIINGYLLTDVSDLSDADFRHFNSLFNLGEYVNKYAFPTLKYYFDEANCHIYLIGLNDFRHFIGYYNENGVSEQLTVCVPLGFMNRRTINTLSLFGITSKSEGLVLKNLLYLDRASYYFKDSEMLSSAAFKFEHADASRFGSHFVKHKNTFVISKTTQNVTFHYNHTLYVKTPTGESYIASILSQKFKTGLENYLSSHTLTLFDKKFNKLNKKELLLLKMYNIGNTL